jgi:hypothetical protein
MTIAFHCCPFTDCTIRLSLSSKVGRMHQAHSQFLFVNIFPCRVIVDDTNFKRVMTRARPARSAAMSWWARRCDVHAVTAGHRGLGRAYQYP